MWAVYFVGPDDSFLQAMFADADVAWRWANESCRPFIIKEWKTINDIDTTDTGWEQN